MEREQCINCGNKISYSPGEERHIIKGDFLCEKCYKERNGEIKRIRQYGRIRTKRIEEEYRLRIKRLQKEKMRDIVADNKKTSIKVLETIREYE